MATRTARLTTAITLLAIMLLSVFAMAQPAHAASTGCAFFDSIGVFGPSTGTGSAADFAAGETIYLNVTGASGTTVSWLKIGGTQVMQITGDGTLSYTFPSSGNFAWDFATVDKSDVMWGHRCGAVPVGGTVAEPFFQNSMPAAGVLLNEARQTPYMGQLPIDVFEPHWWGVKHLSAALFPLLAGIDMTTVEVRCLDNAGNWNTDHVTVWNNTENKLEVLIKQHGFCGIFYK